ncbi:MAG: hypothetical protein B6D55_07320 [Candidatus Omnitrophica bacterium 4484_70.2]|nr:MAG: hypothetical protein B6D55_07320 [Candidatus Omnitrophica bacterium 4484_70.2]
MNKVSPLSSLDSKRLETSFFRSSGKQRKKRIFKTIHPFILTLPLIIVVSSFLYIFFLNYQLLILPREKIKLTENTQSLLNKKLLNSIHFLSQGGNFHPFSKFIYLPFANENTKKNGIILNFKKPLNLKYSQLLVVLKKTDDNFKIQTIMRDNKFHSNTFLPLETEVWMKNNDSLYQYVPIKIKELSPSNINLCKITQIRFLFFRENSHPSSILIRDIILKKEEK